jgi:hypothetical protein
MKHDLTTGTWQDDNGCPISIILVSISDAVKIGGPAIILTKNKIAPNAIFRVVSCLYILYDLTCLILLRNSTHSLIYIWLTVASRCILLVTD